MVRAGGEDRVEPDRIDAERLQVVQLLLDALEVAAEEVDVERRRRQDRLVPRRVRLRVLVAVEDGTASRRSRTAVVVRRVAVAEAVGEDRSEERRVGKEC